jgi:uncharacterized repeat protein (TIGR02543 family)
MYYRKLGIGIFSFFIFLTACGGNNASSNSNSSSPNISSITPSSSVVEVDENAPTYQSMEFIDQTPPNATLNSTRQLLQKPKSLNTSSLIEDIIPEGDFLPMDYYGDISEEVFVNIYLDNPFQFEILSFTLNEDKYQSFQFETGSNSELLILKISLPSQPGRYEYTIDQIKYVEGTDIKDVRIDGDQTVKVGVSFTSMPTISVAPLQITKHSIQSSINVVDDLNQLEDEQTELKLILLSDDSIVFTQDLVKGNQNFLIDELPSGQTFDFIVAGLFDLIDGSGYNHQIYRDELVKTSSFIEFVDVSFTTDSVAFNLNEIDSENLGTLSKVQILEGEEFVEEIIFSNSMSFAFDNLFSNTEYTLQAVYNYQIQGTNINAVLIESFTFTTDFFQTPEVEYVDVTSTNTTINFNLEVTDPDQVGTLSKIEIFENTTLVATLTGNTNQVFSNLKPNTVYQMVATYTYNLLDGYGEQTLSSNYQTSTTGSLVNIQSGSILLTGGSTVPNVGEEIQLRLNLTNPDGRLVTGVIMNGEFYPVIVANSTIVSIKFVPDTLGGLFEINITGLVYSLNGLSLVQRLNVPYQNSTNVLGGLDVTNFMMADGREYVNIRLTTEELVIEIDNPFGYTIYEVVILFGNKEEKFTGSQIVMYDDGTIFLEWRGPRGAQIYFGEMYAKVSLKSITYGTSLDRSKNQLYSDVFEYFYFVTSDVVQNISTPAQLVNIQSGRFTSINNDLDLSAYGNWVPKDFTGIIHGNGHKISNLSIFVTENTSSTQTFGLFKNFVGKIDGLIIDFASIDITATGDVQVGFIAGSSSNNSGMEVNEVRIMNSIMNVRTEGMVTAGGFGGGLGFGKNSYMENVSMTISSSSTTKQSSVGGFFNKVFNTKSSSDPTIILDSGYIKDAYTTRLMIDVTTNADVFVGGFTATSNPKANFDNLFHSSLSISVNSGESTAFVDVFSNNQILSQNLFIGDKTALKVNASSSTLVTGPNVVDENLFKSNFIYNTLNWNQEIWTYIGKESNLLPFIIEPYSLVFFSNGGTAINTITQDYLTLVNEPQIPVKNGYTFDGWYLEQTFLNQYLFDFIPFEGANLYAKWIVNIYDITYILNNGVNSQDNVATFTVEDLTFTLFNPSRLGYTFNGWYDNANFTGTPVTSINQGTYRDVTVYAKWTLNTYTISYELNGGVNGANPGTYTVITETISLEEATRVGYTFVGWYGNEELSGEAVTSIELGSVGDVTLYAKFEINAYTISFESNEGSVVSAITQDYATEVVEPEAPTREGYTFAGWFSDEALTEAYEFSTMAAEDVTVYAKWTLNPSEE